MTHVAAGELVPEAFTRVLKAIRANGVVSGVGSTANGVVSAGAAVNGLTSGVGAGVSGLLGGGKS